MPLLISPARLVARRAVAAEALAPLADALAAELAPLLDVEPFIPPEKARLTRLGGRCPRDGTLLDFDPWSPRAHRCPDCGTVHTGDEHYRMWIMWYQLWLAERAVHGALLHAVRGDVRHARLAASILERLADAYESYPNRDNALGPTRLFFSTYLESIWLLQMCIALDLLESSDVAPGLGGVVRDRLIAPSRELIASYDEGGSNRQVWNDAALLASARLLGDEAAAEAAVLGPNGVAAQLREGLLADGTWYEGENYHLFAHRGLWYGVVLAEQAGLTLPSELVARFEEGFATPFVSALPDFTLPSRRDSQYAISLRQWRFAELCELGLARRDDARLTAALHALYHSTVPRRPTGRATSAAESERNVGPSALSRADLGWRSLLHARPTLPVLEELPAQSAVLEGQGLAILRRDAGRIWVALDYGHSGGGHGHPDRLNLLLADGPTRWLDDMGTGSYVERALHWYRSTLAHNAPLVDGCSQQRVHGDLRAWEERGAAGWVRAEVPGIAPGVDAIRTVVAMPDYVVDVLEWTAARDALVDLPIHLDGELWGVSRWREDTLAGGRGLEDGFDFLRETARAERGHDQQLHLCARRGEAAIDARVHAPGAELWRAVAPGAPGTGDATFFILRTGGSTGRIIAAWDIRGSVAGLDVTDESIDVTLVDGARHRHTLTGDTWHIDLVVGSAASSIDLGGARPPRSAPADGVPGIARRLLKSPADVAAVLPAAAPEAVPARALVVPRVVPAAGWIIEDSGSTLRLQLAEREYRRSEDDWLRAGAPSAVLAIGAVGEDLELNVAVRTPAPRFVTADAANPFDNEHADLDGSGIQLYFTSVLGSTVIADGVGFVQHEGWVLVPELGSDRVRVRPVTGHAARTVPYASWRSSCDGYDVRVRLPLKALLRGTRPEPFHLGLIVNHITPGRERRSGQLVLGGARGEWVYLQGDRHAPRRWLPFIVAHD